MFLKMKKKKLHLHLVSDATGETVHQIARAALSQFTNLDSRAYMDTCKNYRAR